MQFVPVVIGQSNIGFSTEIWHLLYYQKQLEFSAMLCSQVITISLLLIMVRIAVIVMVWQDNHKAASALVGVKKHCQQGKASTSTAYHYCSSAICTSHKSPVLEDHTTPLCLKSYHEAYNSSSLVLIFILDMQVLLSASIASQKSQHFSKRRSHTWMHWRRSLPGYGHSVRTVKEACMLTFCAQGNLTCVARTLQLCVFYTWLSIS